VIRQVCQQLDQVQATTSAHWREQGFEGWGSWEETDIGREMSSGWGEPSGVSLSAGSPSSRSIISGTLTGDRYTERLQVGRGAAWRMGVQAVPFTVFGDVFAAVRDELRALVS
jgi:hypothetical protein